MQVNMKARQIREIKPYRYFQVEPEDLNNLDDFEFVFSRDNAYKINIYTGETIWHDYGKLFPDYSNMVDGIPDDMDVLVDIGVYRAWLETKENGLGAGKMCLKPLFDMPEDYVFKRMETFDPNEWVKDWEKENEPNI